MDSLRALRLAVMGYCVLFAACISLGAIEESLLPPVLQAWWIAQSPPALPVIVGAIGMLGIGVGCLGLFAGRKWGAWLHLYGTTLCAIATAFLGPQVASAALSTVDGLTMIVSGLIYGLAFFTDAFAPRES